MIELAGRNYPIYSDRLAGQTLMGFVSQHWITEEILRVNPEVEPHLEAAMGMMHSGWAFCKNEGKRDR